jgi:hypothetical protein
MADYKCGFCNAENAGVEATSKGVRSQPCWLVLCAACKAILGITPQHVLKP